MAISEKARVAVLTEAGYRCTAPNCHNELTVDVHHIVEVSKNGGDEPDNLLPLCPYCHSKYHRGLIKDSSIREWKKRIVNIYNKGTNSLSETNSEEQERDLKIIFTRLTANEKQFLIDAAKLIPEDQITFSKREHRDIEAEDQEMAVQILKKSLEFHELEQSGMVLLERGSVVTLSGQASGIRSCGSQPHGRPSCGVRPEWADSQVKELSAA